MKIVYITSWYPSMNDTFVVREIFEIAKGGGNVVICVLKGSLNDKISPKVKPIEHPNISILPFKVSSSFLLSVIPLFFQFPKKFLKCIYEVALGCFCQPQRSHHFIYIFLAATFFAKRREVLEADYIHCHFLHSESLAAYFLSKLTNIPYGFTAHIAKIRYPKKLIINVIADASIRVGDTMETVKFIENLSGKKCVLIRNGIDPATIPFKERSLQVEKNFRILACGALLPPKGFSILIEACKILKNQGVKLECKIVGEGPQRRSLEKLGEELIRDGILSLPGIMPINELLEEYKKSDLFVMPSVPCRYGTDGLPTVLIEAMASGIPVIGSKHAAIPEIIVDKETGILIPPSDPVALANAIKRCIENYSFCLKIAKKARRKVEEEFNLGINAEKFIKYISKIKEGGLQKLELTNH